MILAKLVTALGLMAALVTAPALSVAATTTPASAAPTQSSNFLPLLGALGLYIGVSALASVTSNIAVSSAIGPSFGGIVAPPPAYVECDGAVLFTVIPRGFTPSAGPFIWLPGTKPNSVNFGAQPVPGQQITGRASWTPFPCWVGPVLVGWGLLIPPIPGYGTSVAP